MLAFVPLKITMTDDHALNMTRATRRAILKKTYIAIGQRWVDKWLPKHFVRRARQRYNYRTRSNKWQAKKKAMASSGKAKKGGRVDLVFKGLCETLFARPHVVRGYPTRAVVRMHGPEYVTMRPKKTNKNPMGPEILRVIDEEHDDLDKYGGAVLEDLIKRAPPRRRRYGGRKT